MLVFVHGGTQSTGHCGEKAVFETATQLEDLQKIFWKETAVLFLSNTSKAQCALTKVSLQMFLGFSSAFLSLSLELNITFSDTVWLSQTELNLPIEL